MAKINLGKVRPTVDKVLDESSPNPIANSAVAKALKNFSFGGFKDIRQISDSERTLKKAVSTINEMLGSFGVPPAPNTTEYTNTNIEEYGFRELCAGKSSDGKDILVAASDTGYGIVYSRDGLTFTRTNIQDGSGKFEDPVYSPDLHVFVASGTTGIYASEDGITFSKVLSETNCGETSLWDIPLSNGTTKHIFLCGMKISEDGVNWKGVRTNISSNGVIIPAADSSTGYRAVIPTPSNIVYCDNPAAATSDSDWITCGLVGIESHRTQYDTFSEGVLADGSRVIFAAPTGTARPTLYSNDGKTFSTCNTPLRQWETPKVINGTNIVILPTMATATNGEGVYVTTDFKGADTEWIHITADPNGTPFVKTGYYTPKEVVGSDGTVYYVTAGYKTRSRIIFTTNKDFTKWYSLDYPLMDMRAPTQYKDTVTIPTRVDTVDKVGRGVKAIPLSDFEYVANIAMNKVTIPDVPPVGDEWTEEDLVTTINNLVATVNAIKNAVL
jgi:hypothetical protein